MVRSEDAVHTLCEANVSEPDNMPLSRFRVGEGVGGEGENAPPVAYLKEAK